MEDVSVNCGQFFRRLRIERWDYARDPVWLVLTLLSPVTNRGTVGSRNLD